MLVISALSFLLLTGFSAPSSPSTQAAPVDLMQVVRGARPAPAVTFQIRPWNQADVEAGQLWVNSPEFLQQVIAHVQVTGMRVINYRSGVSQFCRNPPA